MDWWTDVSSATWVGGYSSEQVGVNSPLTGLFKMTKSILLYWSVIPLSFTRHLQTLPCSLHPSVQPPPPPPPTMPSRSLLIQPEPFEWKERGWRDRELVVDFRKCYQFINITLQNQKKVSSYLGNLLLDRNAHNCVKPWIIPTVSILKFCKVASV